MSIPPALPPSLPPSALDYANPIATLPTACHAEGDLIVSSPQIDLPHRCVYCNEPEAKRITMKYSWHHPALYLLILTGVLIYAIVALVVQKKGVANMSLCSLHVAKRSRKILVLWLITVCLLSLIVIGPVLENVKITPRDSMIFFILIGIFGGLIGLVAASQGGRALKAKFIDDRMMKLGGAGEPFLRSLGSMPQMPVARPA